MTDGKRTDDGPSGGPGPLDWLSQAEGADWSGRIGRLLDIAALNAEMLLSEAEEIAGEDEFIGALLTRLAASYATTARRLLREQTS